MSHAIWKYSFSDGDFADMSVPRGAQFLDVQLQGDEVVAWALVDPDAERALARLRLVGTGQEFMPEGSYFGTVQVGILVFHAFALVAA